MAKPLVLRYLADTKAIKQALSDMEGGHASFGSRVASAAGIAAKAVGAAAITGAGYSIKAFADFDAKMQQSVAIMGDVSAEMRSKMEGAARDVAKTTKFSATEAAESYFYLASAGLDAASSIKAMPTVAKFAQAGMFDMALATDLLTDAQSALGLTIRDDAVKNMENMIRVSDVLVKANTLSNATVEQFSESLTNKAGAALRLVNKDVEEGVAVLAAFADQGTKGTEAGEKLNIVLRDLQNASINNRAAFEKHGISVFDSAGKMRNMADIIQDLEGALAGMSDEQKRVTLTTLGFQDRSVSAIAALLGSSEAIREYETKLRSAGGTTEEIAKKQLQTFNAQMGLMKDRVKDVFIGIGSFLVPKLLEAGEAAAKGFKDGEVSSQGFAGAMGQLGVIAGGVRDWFIRNREAIEEFGNKVRDFVGNVLAALAAWWDEWGPTVIGIVTAIKDAIVLAFNIIVGAIGFFAGHWNTIGPLITTVATLIAVVMIPRWIALGVAATVNAAKNAAGWLSTQLAAIRAAVVHSAQVTLMVARWVILGAQAIASGALIATAWAVYVGGPAVANALVHVAQVGVMVAKWVFLGAQSLLHAAKVAAAWLIAMGPIALIIAAVVAVVAVIIRNWDTIVRVTRELWTKVKDFFSGLWDGIRNGVRAAVEWVVDKFNWLKDKIMAPVNAIKDAIKKLPFVPGSPIPMVTWAQTAVEGVNRAWQDFKTPEVGAALSGVDAGIPAFSPSAMSVRGNSRGSGTVNITIELDGETIARAVGAPLVDEIRLKTGLKI